MRAATCYWLVLLIYIALWGCQMFVCNSTHSLIVLTDSYINLYYIIEVSLELFYLHVQSKFSSKKEHGKPAYRILGRTCSYQFKRLPLLGTFMNSVFLSALLMYAAIEGIQSCFHAHHLINEGGKSIILQHELTYPLLLIGFACVGILMRLVLESVHKKRDEESKKSTDLPDFKANATNKSGTQNCSASLNSSRSKAHSQGDMSLSQLSVDQLKRNKSGVVLKSFKLHPDVDSMSSVYIPVGGDDHVSQHREMLEVSRSRHRLVKHAISPIALIACALIVHYIPNEMITEVADAILAIVVVVVVYIASYPSMDYAGRTILQTAPMDLNLDNLIDDLKSISPLISSVEDLHVWSLTNDKGRIGTCNLVISKDDLKDDKEVVDIIREAGLKFSIRGVRCSSVQPVMFSAAAKDAAKEEKQERVNDSHEHNESGHDCC